MIGLMAVLLRLQEAGAAGEPVELTGGSIAFMLTAMIGVTGLTIWCFARILRSPGGATGDPGPEAGTGGTADRDKGR